MTDVPDELVTVAVLPGETEANLVKNQLGAAGIDAYLDGAEAAAMSWHMTGAFGGIKVQVAASDAEDAQALLEKRAWQDKPKPPLPRPKRWRSWVRTRRFFRNEKKTPAGRFARRYSGCCFSHCGPTRHCCCSKFILRRKNWRAGRAHTPRRLPG